jgi:hypothetical protein
MRESIKSILALIFIVTGFTTGFMWFDDRDTGTIWYIRIGSTAAALTSLAVLLKLHFQADKAPDYLRQVAGNYFNRDGFCIACAAIAREGVCQFVTYFQNQYDRPCIAQVAIRPGRNFFLGRSEIETFAFEVKCGPAAFGIAKFPVPLPNELQGKRQPIDVGASVDYPRGKGNRIRFRDGIVLRANAQFKNSFATALTVAGAAGGAIVLTTPARTTLALPAGVAEQLTADAQPEIVELWKLGDPPLNVGSVY